MSHFSVAVFTMPNGKTVEQLLAPYQENNMGDCPKEFLEFCCVEDELREEYKECAEKDKYPDYDTYALKYAGYKKDKKTGMYGYWYNPNSKWDWYQIGGRFSGMLKLKPGAKGKKGERSWTNASEHIPDDMVDSARIKDIDFEWMIRENVQLYEKFWIESEGKDEYIRYISYGINPGMTYEQYMEKAIAFSTFAVILPGGQWYEEGQMGWWAIVSNSDREWHKNYKKRFIDTADPEWTLTIVDCHI